MKKLALALLLATSAPALAGVEHYPIFHHHHFVKATVPSSAPTAAKPVPASEGQKWSCWMNPAAALICVVTVAIVVDEIKRSVYGPACASGKLDRQSYFGMVVDEPKLWRPLCNFKS